MKRLMSLFFCLAICQSSAFAADVVNMAIGEWAPFTSEKDPKGKLTEKVVTEAYKLEGVDVKFSYFPWKRSSTMVEEGASDASFPCSYRGSKCLPPAARRLRCYLQTHTYLSNTRSLM